MGIGRNGEGNGKLSVHHTVPGSLIAALNHLGAEFEPHDPHNIVYKPGELHQRWHMLFRNLPPWSAKRSILRLQEIFGPKRRVRQMENVAVEAWKAFGTNKIKVTRIQAVRGVYGHCVKVAAYYGHHNGNNALNYFENLQFVFGNSACPDILDQIDRDWTNQLGIYSCEYLFMDAVVDRLQRKLANMVVSMPDEMELALPVSGKAPV